jgi:ParB family transcriptional regulator, chromosome partitioning protein
MPKSQTIPFDKIMEPHAPARFAMDEEKLAELVESIRAQGLLQPIGVFQNGELYEITFGHRRYKACQIIGLKEIDCRVFDTPEKARHAAMLDENLCREDITAAEEAEKYAEIILEYDCTEQELMDIVKRPPAYVYARLDLLKKDKGVFAAVAARQIVLSVAQQLNRVKDAGHCAYLLRMAIENGASARVVAGWVVDYLRNGPGATVDLTAFKEAGAQGAVVAEMTKCVLCRSAAYQANLKWVPVHDFELDQLLAQINAAAPVPTPEEVQP